MNTGQESPQSVSFVGYYKGFSVTITKRDAEAKVLPLIDDAILAIDDMLSKGFKPSWNDETNKAIQNPGSTAPIQPQKKTYYPPKNSYPNSNNPVNQETCSHDDPPEIKVSKSAKNPGRSFRSCTRCHAFLGWV